jgi:hypothetical protein
MIKIDVGSSRWILRTAGRFLEDVESQDLRLEYINLSFYVETTRKSLSTK